MIFVETDRLLLRKVAEEDFAYFRDYLMDKEMDRMMPVSYTHLTLPTKA